ncbi:ribose transport system permease protein [Nakamurella panacisegetis]|uniref:Autoinducer 2 import system permease protein LsrC n=1 Tax=Nakamurella panacisegetis TaxID=1090615 RepID=A0A1H0LGS8_9ACTN|nr:ABC transporter permease [Nakamurella panacisegetis]SDO67332.1 ribose transport system permease protein [Nakamurella panacisegetis]
MTTQLTDAGSATSEPRVQWSGAGTPVALAATWLVLIVASALHRSDFLSRETLLSVAFTMAVTGVLAVGQAVVAISGGILDLSVPAALIIPSFAIADLLGAGVSSGIAVVVGVLAGAAWGLLNGLIIVAAKINPIIVTLGSNFVGVGVLYVLQKQAAVPTASGLRRWGQHYLLGLPSIWWPMLVLIVLVGVLLPRTRIGRRTIGVGGNPVAAKARGISLARTRLAVFTFSGACGGVAAVLFSASTPQFVPTDSATFLLPVIAAVIVAGISLSGGRGSLLTLLLSVGLLSTVPTALVFFGLNSNWQIVFQGLILIVAVSIDGQAQKKAKR